MATVFQSAPLIRGETELGEIMCPGDPFQSTSLIRGETRERQSLTRCFAFQSTPLMRGETLASAPSVSRFGSFNPLPSHEGRQGGIGMPRGVHPFQSTPLTRGETPVFVIRLFAVVISIHSPHTRGDQSTDRKPAAP